MDFLFVLILEQSHLHYACIVWVKFVQNGINLLVRKVTALRVSHFFEVLHEALSRAEVIDTSGVERISLDVVYI